jgi:phenylacetate-CoA ligase
MRHLTIIIFAWLADASRNFMMKNIILMNLLFLPGFNSLRHFNGIARAYARFCLARKHVPAYKAFLENNNFKRPSFIGLIPQLSEIPVTDKVNYVSKFTMNERCLKGSIPATGVVIDESSGSSGMPVNWVRGRKEREYNARFIRFNFRHAFGKASPFIINAFAMGAWATGVNVTMSCVGFSKLKSLGPDKLKIENTLKQFGPSHKYIIMGYPPFLKSLVDEARISWKDYDISFIFGGESMSEGMREYLYAKGIRQVFSSLGASDLELNLAGENEFTISLRKLIISNETLRHRMLRFNGAVPMIFQFNPADFLIETSADGHLIFTICRPGYIAPKIRYDVHDRGHTLEIRELYQILDELKIDRSLIRKPQVDLPLLFHYGRADMTVSFFGCNITPNDIHEVIFSLPGFADHIASFQLTTPEDQDGNKTLIIHLEKNSGSTPSAEQLESFKTDFFNSLSALNQDFREARKMVPSESSMQLILHNSGTGPFIGKDIRIKSKYLS